jgi:hypothetical protein
VRRLFKRLAEARRVLLSLAAIVAVPAFVGVADGAASTDRSFARSRGPDPVAAATLTRRFDAWSADGEPALRVRGRRRGDCNSSSFVNGRTDAWRCFVGRFILDPCFESPVADDRVLCVRSPWTRWGWLVLDRLDYKLRDDSVRQPPWALVLTGGRRCGFVSGATGFARGRRLNYLCAARRGPRPCPCLFGRPDRRRPVWRIFAGDDVFGRGWRRLRIRTAWN